MSDNVNHPSHYIEGRSIEPIEVIEDWSLGFHLGNALKYVSRVGRKNDDKEDLEKAIWYLTRELESLERDAQGGVVVGDVVVAVEVDDTPMLTSDVRYVVAGVNTGPEKTFICLSDQPARYWDVARFEVIA